MPHWISPHNRETLQKINERVGNNWFHHKDVVDIIAPGELTGFYQRGFLDRQLSDIKKTTTIRKWKLNYNTRSRL